MVASASAQCRACLATLKTVVSTLSDSNKRKGRIHHGQVNDELERFSLWIGNIGALHLPESTMSLESRLCEASDILIHVLELLNDLNEVTGELLAIVSGEREGEIASTPHGDNGEADQNEETELLGEIGACITSLFRVSSLIRQAAPTDVFAKALSRNRYRFNDQYDIAHVGEKYPKLAAKEFAWLQKRLGRAITQRRQYLSYIQDHREKLEGILTHDATSEHVAPKQQAPIKQLPSMELQPDSSSRPSTFFTKASSLIPGRITPQMLTTEEESDPENDARSYTTISRSVDGDIDAPATMKIPKLDELQAGSKKEVECPFCFRMKKFKNERVWRRHVFSDLHSYVCTFPNCEAPCFGDINEWFRHEMQSHRVSYICQLCLGRTFQLKERYLAHVRRQHPKILENGEEQPVLDIARKPLNEIPALQCPCCSEWVDRLKERAIFTSVSSDISERILSVNPTVFKRHLASHLEQLALFAIPIGLAAEDDVNSAAAIAEDADALSGNSGLSSLAFGSPESSSREEVEAALGNKENERSEIPLLIDRIGDDSSITEEVINAAVEKDLKEAIKLARQAIDVTPKDHPDLADKIINLGNKLERWYEHTGNLDYLEEAIQVVQQAINVTPKDHPDLAGKIINLGNKFESMYNRTEAINYLEEAIRVARQAIELTPDDHPGLPGRLNSLGIKIQRRDELKKSVEDLEEVAAIYREAIVAGQKILGSMHSDTLASMDSLASLYQNQGRWKEAEELEVQIIETRKRVLGEEHPDTLINMDSLASLYQNQGRWKEAEELEVKIIETRKRVLGEEHPGTLISMDSLASIYQNQGRWKEAEELEVQIIETKKRVLREEHPDMLISMESLASIYQNQGRWKEAEELEVQVIETRKRVLGEEHPGTLISMDNLALTYQNQGRWKEAEELELQVIETRKRVLGEEHPGTLTSMANLACTLNSQNRKKEATSLMETCFQLRTQILGPLHPSTKSSAEYLKEWWIENSV